MTARKPVVAVVFGGRSTEHSISCLSAGSVLEAIDRDRYEVVPVGIAPDGRWLAVADDPKRLALADGVLPTVAGTATGPALALLGQPGARDLVVLDPTAGPSRLASVDVVLPLLHGPYGEDGTLQGLLELAGVPYVGSGVLASALCMDKEYMKQVLAARGFEVGRHAVVRPRDDAAAAAAGLGYPLFVKPARGGSSLGISKVHEPGRLAAALETARGCDPKVVLEAAVAGREIECGVLEAADGAVEASLPAEIHVVGGQEFYDFEAKYLAEATAFDVPARLPAETTARVRETAVRAFAALGCEGLARVDFFLLDDGRLVVNEVNTMPGFTPASMFPRMWAATGVDYAALVDRLLRTALARPSTLR